MFYMNVNTCVIKHQGLFLVRLFPIIIIVLTIVSCKNNDSVSEPDGEINGYGYVDLELPSGTLWATMNLGANKIEDFGEYYAWGESETKLDFSWHNYKYYKGGYSDRPSAFPTYNELENIGEEISNTKYDAAHVIMEETWVMPTKAQIDELQDSSYCEWTWINNGYCVKSKINGKSIFLPAAGFKESDLDDLKSGYYQSSTLCEGVPCCNYFLSFYSGDHSTNGSSIYYGRTIRPVICATASSEPNLTTGQPLYNDKSTATVLNCQIKGNWSSVLNHGICWNTSGNPTISDNYKVEGHRGVPSYNVVINGLEEGKTYYIRAYATNNVGTSYGEEIIYTHKNNNTSDGKQNGHEYVDLGLPSGTKWATMNIGASAPEDYGNYYAWGETETKETYNWSTYKYFFDNNGDNVPYDDNWRVESGELKDIGCNIAGTQYDVAHMKWGDSWKIPTSAQIDELQNRKYCEWIWTFLNGVKGYIVTSKLNGKSIFLPACGVFYSNEQQLMNTDGHYWLSTSEANNAFYADYLIFSSKSHETCHKSELFQDYNGRDHGRAIRPVFTRKNEAK